MSCSTHQLAIRQCSSCHHLAKRYGSIVRNRLRSGVMSQSLDPRSHYDWSEGLCLFCTQTGSSNAAMKFSTMD